MTKLTKATRLRKASINDLERALRKCEGLATDAARLLKMSRQAVHDRIKDSIYLQDVLRDIRERQLDGWESGVFKDAKRDKASRRWLLERKGKHRGYATKVETETKLSEGELEAIASAFGGDLGKLRKLRAALDPAKTAEP